MSVHYKFKSSLDYDTVTFDGLHISVGDLKKAILQQKKIGKGFDFDLQITNAQTKEVYADDEALISKNASVIVSRVPNSSSTKKSWERNDSSSLLPAVATDGSESSAFDRVTKNADLVSSNVSEDEKIRAMMSQSTQDYDPSRYVKTKGMTGPIPPNYTCFRCGRAGHWIKQCPTNALDVKRSTGIPRSFMVTVEGPEVPGALLTSTGHFAVPMIDHEAYKEGKKEKPPFAKEPSPEKEPVPEIPEELLCMICRDLLSDAVLIPCCGNSYCDECVRQALLDSDEHECPTCHEKDISPDTLIPNRFLRTAVMNFKNETGYTKVKKPPMKAVPVEQPSLVEAPESQPPMDPPAEPAPEVKEEVLMQDLKVPSPVVAAATEEDSKISTPSTSTSDHLGTPVRDEKLDNEAIDEGGGSDSNLGKNSDDGTAKGEREESPMAYQTIMTITTRNVMAPPIPILAAKTRLKVPIRDARDLPPHLASRKDPNPESASRMSRPLPREAAPTPVRLTGQPPPQPQQQQQPKPPGQQAPSAPQPLMSLCDPAPAYVPPQSSTSIQLAQTSGVPPTYTTALPPMKPPPPGMLLPPVGVPPPHLLGLPHFPHNVQHPPPPIPPMFHRPPPLHQQHRRPMLPPPGPNPLGGPPQPLPPGVRPLMPPPPHLIPSAADVYHHHHLGSYPPPRADDYYRDRRGYGDRDRSVHDPMDVFARKLFDYRREGHRSRRRSASSSRSCSSRSGYHSRSPSSRSNSRSARSSRSRSRSCSYSSRSRSSSPSYSRSHSRSPYSQRSRSVTRSRSRSRSRPKMPKYSPQSHRKSRSLSPRKRRSPPPPPIPMRRHREYSPNYYPGMYRGQPPAAGPPPPTPHPPPQLAPPPPAVGQPYEIHRGRYVDPYRYENYRYEEDPRYVRDPRYDYLQYEDYYHQRPEMQQRPNRSWGPMGRGKPDDYRGRMTRTDMVRRGGQHSRSPLPLVQEKEMVVSRDRNGRRRPLPEKSKNYRDDGGRREDVTRRDDSRREESKRDDGRRDDTDRNRESNRELTRPNSDPKGVRKTKRGQNVAESEKSVPESRKDSSSSKVVEDKMTRSASSEKMKDKEKEKRHKRKAHHHHEKTESPIKKVKAVKKGSEMEAASSGLEGSSPSRKSARKKKKKTKDGNESTASANTGAPKAEPLKSGKGGETDKGKVAIKAEKKDAGLIKEEHRAATKTSPARVKGENLVGEKEAEEKSTFHGDGLEGAVEGTAEGVSTGRETVRRVPNKVVPLQPEEKDEDGLELEANEPLETDPPRTDEMESRESVEAAPSAAAEEDEPQDEEEEDQEDEIDENVLTAPVPELSKWELEDVDLNRQEDVSKDPFLHRHKAKPDTKQHSLPLDIVQRAEKAILQKPMKAIPTAESGKVARKVDSKDSPEHAPVAVSAATKEKEGTLKISIESGNSKRVVEKTTGGSSGASSRADKAARDAGRDRVRLDRSKFVEREHAERSSSISGRSDSGGAQKSNKGEDEERTERHSSKDRRGDSRQDSHHQHKIEASADKERSTHDEKVSSRYRRHGSPERSAHGSALRRESRHDEHRRQQESPERGSHSQERTRRSSRDRGRQERSESRGRGPRETTRSERDSERSRRGTSDRDRRHDDKRSGRNEPAIKRDEEKSGASRASRDHREHTPEEKSCRRRDLENESRSKSGNRPDDEPSKNTDARRSGDSSASHPASGDATRVDRRSSTIDESKFEPDYDDTDESVSGGSRNKRKSPPKDVARKKRSSSSMSSSSSISSPESSGASPPKKVRVSPALETPATTEKASKHKKSKHKKHKKHKHKHKKKKSKQKDEEKGAVKSIVKH